MSYSILVVDDSTIVRTMVRKALGTAGLDIGQVHEAADGREALELLGRTWIDVVFADVNMPHMGGVELVRAMRQTPALAATPVVIVSSERSQARIDELRANGVQGYVQKPFRPEHFRAVIDGLLGPQGSRS